MPLPRPVCKDVAAEAFFSRSAESNQGVRAMPITPTLTVNPTTMTNNWSLGLQSPTNQQKLINKYLNPKALYNANPTQSQQAWSTGVTRALAAGKYASGLANSDPNQAAANMQQYGGQHRSTTRATQKHKLTGNTNKPASTVNHATTNL